MRESLPHTADEKAATPGPSGTGPGGCLTDLLLNAADHGPASGVLCLADDGADTAPLLTYPELLQAASRMTGALRSAGLRPGDRVALLLERAEDFIPAFWGCVLGGYVPCPLVPLRTDTERWAAQLTHVNTLLDGPLLVTTARLKGELPAVPGLAVACVEDLASAEPATDFHRAAPEDLALLVLTSGSTGAAKAVMLTHGNLLASMRGKNGHHELRSGDTTLNWISFDHVAALLECHLLPLSVGATQIHIGPEAILEDPLRFIRLIDAHRVTVTFTPNFLLGYINSALERPPADFAPDLSCLRHIVSGGEAVVCATGLTFLDRLAPYGLSRGAVWPAFGMTETCAGSVYSREFPAVDAGQEFASLGTAVRGLELRTVDDDDVPLTDGTAGELQLRGPMVCTGYYNNDAATRQAFTDDGWFRTGDLGTLADGRLTLVGRSKDSIIVNGVNYFSHDLETVLEQLDGVEPSYVAAFPTRRPGSDTEQLVVAFAPSAPLDALLPGAEGADDRTEDADDRTGAAGDRTEPADDRAEAELHRLLVAIRGSIVLHWGFRPTLLLPLPADAFPKTSLGKIQRALLRKRLESGELSAYERQVAELTERRTGGHTAPEGDTETTLAKIYAGLFDADPDTLSATASFFELGGTSLDILRLKSQVERTFGIANLPVLDILRAPSVRALAQRLDAGQAAGPAAYDPLVPLQTTGSKTPLFCVHPGVGEVLVFVNLAAYFTQERPFYALRARGFNAGESYFTEFDEMVQCYVRAIRERQPHGPYAVAGYSYGGAVAFEIAKTLEAQGERVDFVGIFNLPPHIKPRMEELDFIEGAVNLAFFLDLIDKEQSERLPAELRALPAGRDPLEALLSYAPAGRLAELDLDLPAFAAWAELAQSLLSMGRTYEPGGSVERLTVFYAIPIRGTKEDWLNLQLKKWDGFSRSPVTYIDVPGEHYTLMGHQHVAAFQDILRRELDQALDGD
ncbi:non-ribosomal peptide synthetase [Streptomyces sp. NPDC052496]|uniref:non-ribosomal peptide synthetase n=1 Tax=Streptomyces sp. NPDC052496 TaxID=3154951 RepID=UPI0034427135